MDLALSAIDVGEEIPWVLLDWSWYGSLWFCFTIATTVGYGTSAPTTQSGRGFLIVYAFLAIPLFISGFVHIAEQGLGWIARGLSVRPASFAHQTLWGAKVLIIVSVAVSDLVGAVLPATCSAAPTTD